MIPFDKHFEESERDSKLKSTFKIPENASGILNWLLKGYQLYVTEGIAPPQRAIDALNEYRRECDTVALFLEDICVKCDNTKWVKTSLLYDAYGKWFSDNCDMLIKPMSRPEFISALRQKVLVERHRDDSYIIKGYAFKYRGGLQAAEQ
jgi:phage/plasmid-associated DNA primase